MVQYTHPDVYLSMPLVSEQDLCFFSQLLLINPVNHAGSFAVPYVSAMLVCVQRREERVQTCRLSLRDQNNSLLEACCACHRLEDILSDSVSHLTICHTVNYVLVPNVYT